MAVEDDLLRTDETQKRLLDWTDSQPPSERLAAQVLDAEGYENIDPSHPLGGPDGGRDGECTRAGQKGVWAVYFPRGQQTYLTISNKLKADIAGASKHAPKFLVFVTNQELRLSERESLRTLGGEIDIEILHLERVAGVLDRPRMAQVRQQFLRISAGRPAITVTAEVLGIALGFDEDGQVFDVFVRRYEDDVRTESNKARERLREEEEEKARAAAVEAARRRTNPLMAGLTLPDFVYENAMQNFPRVDTTLLAGLGYTTPAPEPSQPMSDEEIAQAVESYRSELAARWPACKDYLAGAVGSGLRIRLRNGGGYLSRVQVVMTFHGAKGVDVIDIEDFKWQKLEDPDWKPRRTDYLGGLDVNVISSIRPADYPVEMEPNDSGDLVVTITLPELRPRQVWTSNDDDMVLVVQDQASAVEVSYYLTAAEYHEAIDGESVSVAVKRVPMLDAFKEAYETVRNKD